MTTVRAPGTKMPTAQVVPIQKTTHDYRKNLNYTAPTPPIKQPSDGGPND